MASHSPAASAPPSQRIRGSTVTFFNGEASGQFATGTFKDCEVFGDSSGGQDKKPEYRCDILIIVAKDKEYDRSGALKAALGRQYVAITERTQVLGDLKHSAKLHCCSLEVANGEKAECAILVLGAVGDQGMRFFNTTLLEKLKPKYLTTYGYCTGLGELKGMALVFRQYKNKDGELHIITDHPQYFIKEFWRDFEDCVAEPDLYNIIGTADRVLDTEEEVATFLRDHSVPAADMEIASIYGTFDEYNSAPGRSEADKIVALPAFKGVSDAGLKADREGKPGTTALRNAASAMLYLLRGLALHP